MAVERPKQPFIAASDLAAPSLYPTGATFAAVRKQPSN